MSKYADIEQIKEVIRTEWVKYMPMDLDISLSFVLGKISEVPTIEVSEDCISREYLEEQLQQIEDITAMAHIDLGEDPYDETEEITMPISTVRKIFKNAPSVVPTTEQSSIVDIVTCEECKRCKKGLVIERRADEQETIVNLCNRTKPPTMVSLDFYCKDGERIEE